MKTIFYDDFMEKEMEARRQIQEKNEEEKERLKQIRYSMKTYDIFTLDKSP